MDDKADGLHYGQARQAGIVERLRFDPEFGSGIVVTPAMISAGARGQARRVLSVNGY